MIQHRLYCITVHVDLSDLDRLQNETIVSYRPEIGNASVQTLAYKESTTFPTCSSVSMAAP